MSDRSAFAHLDRLPRRTLELVGIGLLLSVGTSACTEPPVAAPLVEAGTSDRDAGFEADAQHVASATAVDAAADASDAALLELLAQQRELGACATVGGAPPRDISDVVARLNALPAPGSIACLVASLPRPLSVVASSSSFSAQPADGPKSPRIFLMFAGLSISVVPSGNAQDLLELGEWITPLRTLKAELAFPLTRPISDAQPYVRVDDGQGVSVCGFCHGNETPHPTIPHAFVSDALRDLPSYEFSVADLRRVRDACSTPQGSGPHCLLLSAVFDFGEVTQGAFDSAIKTGR